MTAPRRRTFTAWELIRAAAVALVLACVAPAAGDTPGGGGFTGDNDLISTPVEIDPANDYLNFDTLINNPDPSRALGSPTFGSLFKGINLPDNQPSYYHFLGTDIAQRDDWGTLRLLNVGEATAYDWNDPSRICYSETQFHPTRIGMGDLSKGNAATQTFGGDWHPDHNSHQNGLDVDVRYMRKGFSQGEQEQPLDLRLASQHTYYDTAATADLLSCFLSFRDVVLIYVDTRYVGIDFTNAPQVVHDPGHYDHFHVRVVDPDGTNN